MRNGLKPSRLGTKSVDVRRGREAVRELRAAPTSLSRVEAGSWFACGWRRRLLRRVALRVPAGTGWLPERVRDDVGFWSGVRAEATATEWQRLTASSYVVLCYHRLAGTAEPGQERMDVSPVALRRQLRILHTLGWRALEPEAVIAFHTDPRAVLPRRRFVLTADDGFAEAIALLTRQARHHPQVFAVTGAVGGRAGWLGDAPMAGWSELRALRDAGGLVGSHARRHVPLDELDEPAIEQELAGSLADLREVLDVTTPLLAYPHGRHDARVRIAAERAGYELAYTTGQGRNGAGTDRWSLRRVEPKMWDSSLSFAWKVLTGESPPPAWERSLGRRWARRCPAATRGAHRGA